MAFGTEDAASSSVPTIELLGAFRDAVNREQDVISQRMTWLMTMDGLIITGLVVVLGIHELVPPHRQVTPDYVGWVVSLLAIAGVFANASTFFSNYWAERATQGCRRVLNMELRRRSGLNAEGPSTLAADDIDPLLRLWGADPLDNILQSVEEPKGGRIKEAYDQLHSEAQVALMLDPRNDSLRPAGSLFLRDPRSTLFHPWFALPVLFTLVFTVVPFIIRPRGADWSIHICTVVALLLVVSLTVTRVLYQDRKTRADARWGELFPDS
jgi:hypothetical protein